MGVAAAVGAAIVSVVDVIGGAGTALGLGLVDATGAATGLGSAVAGSLIGGGVGALGGEITTGKPLGGLLEGALTGGAIGGLGPALGGALGIGTTAGDALAGAGAGALASGLTKQNPLTGAVEGGAGGLAAGLLSGSTGGTGGGATPTTGTGTGASAAGTAAPTSAAPGGGGFLSNLFGGGSSGVGNLPSLPASPLAASDAASAATYGPTSAFATNPVAAAPAASTGGLLSGLLGGGGGTGGGSGLLGPLVSAGGIGLDLLKGTTPLKNQNALAGEAQQLQTQGQQLESYLQTGNLPPGVSQALKSAADSAKAQIRSQYAAMGGDTSAMQQDLANVDQVTATQGAQIATNLLNQGVSETGLSEQIYGQLLNLTLSQNNALGSAVGNLATAIAGGGRPIIFQQQGLS